MGAFMRLHVVLSKEEKEEKKIIAVQLYSYVVRSLSAASGQRGKEAEEEKHKKEEMTVFLFSRIFHFCRCSTQRLHLRHFTKREKHLLALVASNVEERKYPKKRSNRNCV